MAKRKSIVTPLLITSVSSLYIVNVSSQSSERVVQIHSCRKRIISPKKTTMIHAMKRRQQSQAVAVHFAHMFTSWYT
jgi:hypothetical protein